MPVISNCSSTCFSIGTTLPLAICILKFGAGNSSMRALGSARRIFAKSVSYTAGTHVLFKLGAVSASGEIGNIFFILHVVACVVKVFYVFVGLVFCRELPASCNSFSLFL